MVTKKSAVFRGLPPLTFNTAEKLKFEDSRNAVRMLIQLAVRSLEGKHIQEGALSKVKIKTATCDDLHELYTLVLNIMKIFFYQHSHPVKAELLKEELSELRFPNYCAIDLVSVLTGPRVVVLSNCALKRIILPKVIFVDWKLNITIASCYLSRVLEPSVILNLSLSNGQKREFEIPVSKFHHLRYIVAMVLKEMALLEKKRIFKI